MFFFRAKVSTTNQAFMFFKFHQLRVVEDDLNRISNRT